jgi:membrane protease YdiL (CAAX protease family)
VLKTTIQYKPLSFFILSFVLTWGFWFLGQRYAQSQTAIISFLLLGLVSPFATALGLIFTSGNKTLIDTFFNKLLNLRLIKLKTIPAIILIPPASIIIAIFVSLLFGFSSEQFTVAKSYSFNIGGLSTLLLLFLAASFEELGWRGYAIESLNVKFNYFNATAIFAVLWSLWHLPLLFIPHTYQNYVLQLNIWYAVNFMLSIIPLAFIISWICKLNSGSILAAIFLHFMINFSQEFFMVHPATKCIQSFVLLAFAIILVYTNKEMFFDE